ncbi:hypothetical protein LWI28_010287 [Acer negundo]|uniref:Uncharacterized protein n=1 Tax=Acer negundo TaxID=4023 RepID=A0AAD5J584_ACENE|nr:hypothetical protein LWI28_010287 [Acer negundo]
MMDMVDSEIGGTDVVTVEQGRKRYGAAKFMEKLTHTVSIQDSGLCHQYEPWAVECHHVTEWSCDDRAKAKMAGLMFQRLVVQVQELVPVVLEQHIVAQTCAPVKARHLKRKRLKHSTNIIKIAKGMAKDVVEIIITLIGGTISGVVMTTKGIHKEEICIGTTKTIRTTMDTMEISGAIKKPTKSQQSISTSIQSGGRPMDSEH